MHRIRSGLIEQRTAKGNQIRGLVAEYGLIAPKELSSLRRAIPVLAGRCRQRLERVLSATARWPVARPSRSSTSASANWIARSLTWHKPIRMRVRLQQLRGVGPVVATALIAAVGDAKQFANGRQMAASLGLTPRQHSSGGKDRLLGISKRGDAYVRGLLVHGARSALRTAPAKDDRLSQWVTSISAARSSQCGLRGTGQ